MKYNREKQQQETLENHKQFYSTIKRICDREFVLSSSNPLNHITSLQNKIEVFINTEKNLSIRGANSDQKVRDAEYADGWLLKVFHDLIDSGVSW